MRFWWFDDFSKIFVENKKSSLIFTPICPNSSQRFRNFTKTDHIQRDDSQAERHTHKPHTIRQSVRTISRTALRLKTSKSSVQADTAQFRQLVEICEIMGKMKRAGRANLAFPGTGWPTVEMSRFSWRLDRGESRRFYETPAKPGQNQTADFRRGNDGGFQ